MNNSLKQEIIEVLQQLNEPINIYLQRTPNESGNETQVGGGNETQVEGETCRK